MTALRFLASFCRGHALDEKTFVVPSFIIGRQLGDALARETGSWVNLRFVTLTSLAQGLLEGRPGAVPKKLLTASAQLGLVGRSFRKLQAEGRLEYFRRAGASPGLVRAVYEAVRDLRLDGLASQSLRPELFLVEKKGVELARILELYEMALEGDGALDSAGLLSLAARAAAGSPSQSGWLLCLRDAPLRRLEADFVRAAAGGRLVLVPGDPVCGLERPRHGWPAPEVEDEIPAEPGRLSWLFAPREAPPPDSDPRPDVFRGLGPGNECREILRRIYAEKLRFDEVEVLVPPGSPHPTVFHLLSARTGLPVTFGGGLPISFTSPGRLFFGLADWLAEDYSAGRLVRLLESGDLALSPSGSGAALSGRTAGRHLKSAMIGWGRDRYLERLEALRAGREADLERAGGTEEPETGEADDDRRSRLRRDIAEVKELSAAARTLLELWPATGPGLRYDLRDFASSLRRTILLFGRVDTDLDRQARETLIVRLDEIMDEGPAPGLALKDVLDELREAGASLRVGASPPRPGYLHVAGCLSGGFSGRPVTFVAGLDEDAFPGRGLQDPVLLDDERAALSPSLPVSADALRSNLFGLAATLASLRGRVTLSYSSFDLVEERAAFPSSVVLQAFRLRRGDPDLDYSALDKELPESAGFVPERFEKAFDEVDWWLARLAPLGRDSAAAAGVAANFAWLGSGIAASAARAGARLTEYDGLVDIGPLRDEVDPLAGRRAVMSASRLELLARCPFGYFLRHVLKVRPPEEVAFDRTRWLDPLQRGRLVHAVLFEFMTAVTRSGERVEARRHGPLMLETAARLVEIEKRRIPPPSESVFESERRDLLDALAIFLAAEEKRDESVRPLEFEKEFRAEEIALGRGRSFVLGGFIDRLDRVGPAAYRVLDYKTGSPAAYEGLAEFGGGRFLQHALYAVAAEQLLARASPGSQPRVAESGYFFPTRRGEGREVIVRDFDRDRLRRLLNDLLALIEKGHFFAGAEGRCAFCDHESVCGGGPGRSQGKKELLAHLLELMDDGAVIAGLRTGEGDIDLSVACRGNPVEARRRVEADLRVFESYEKLDDYD